MYGYTFTNLIITHKTVSNCAGTPYDNANKNWLSPTTTHLLLCIYHNFYIFMSNIRGGSFYNLVCFSCKMSFLGGCRSGGFPLQNYFSWLSLCDFPSSEFFISSHHYALQCSRLLNLCSRYFFASISSSKIIYISVFIIWQNSSWVWGHLFWCTNTNALFQNTIPQINYLKQL